MVQIGKLVQPQLNNLPFVFPGCIIQKHNTAISKALIHQG